MNLNTILLIAAIAGPVASWALTSLKADWFDIPAAVASAKVDAKATCDARVTAIQTELNNKAADAIRRAEEAERSIAPTPAEAAELADLCNASASCRDRKKETRK